MDMVKVSDNWAMDFVAAAKRLKIDGREEIGFWRSMSRTFAAAKNTSRVYLGRRVLDRIEKTAILNLNSPLAEIRAEAEYVLIFCKLLNCNVR